MGLPEKGKETEVPKRFSIYFNVDDKADALEIEKNLKQGIVPENVNFTVVRQTLKKRLVSRMGGGMGGFVSGYEDTWDKDDEGTDVIEGKIPDDCDGNMDYEIDFLREKKGDTNGPWSYGPKGYLSGKMNLKKEPN